MSAPKGHANICVPKGSLRDLLIQEQVDNETFKNFENLILHNYFF